MVVYGVFHGGANYSAGSVHNPSDVRRFDSITAAVDTVWVRFTGRDHSFPNVDESATMHLWLSDPRADANDGQAAEYPDRVISIGPRGGVRVERV